MRARQVDEPELRPEPADRFGRVCLVHRRLLEATPWADGHELLRCPAGPHGTRVWIVVDTLTGRSLGVASMYRDAFEIAAA